MDDDRITSAQETAFNHVLAAYKLHCMGIAIMAVLLIPLLVYFGALLPHTDRPASMSAHYYTAGHGFFVGIVFAVGVALLFFPSYTEWQILFKLSGVLAIGVALLPTAPPGGPSNWVSISHGICAVAMFIPIVFVTISPRFGTYHHLPDGALKNRLRWSYIAVRLILVLGLCAVTIAFWGRLHEGFIFWLEAVGVVGFAVFWFARAFEAPALAEGIHKRLKLPHCDNKQHPQRDADGVEQ